jgi:hypothetical protein
MTARSRLSTGPASAVAPGTLTCTWRFSIEMGTSSLACSTASPMSASLVRTRTPCSSAITSVTRPMSPAGAAWVVRIQPYRVGRQGE